MTDNMDDLRQASADVSGVEVLIPAAQAVLDAVVPYPIHEQAIAAALRAAADKAQASVYHSTPTTDWGKGWKEGVSNAAQGFLAIANELDPPTDTSGGD